MCGTSNYIYSNSANVLWAALLEKAFVQHTLQDSLAPMSLPIATSR